MEGQAFATPMPPSVYVVLGLGGFLGGVTKGLTGFGNAIINLLVWVSFTAAGVNGGTLLQAVLADAASCLVVSIPLLLMTHAHKTADWRLVFVMLAFVAAGSPIGAALLTHMDPRKVEGVMAAVLLLVILIHVKLPARAAAAVRAWRQRRRAAAYGKVSDDAFQQGTKRSAAAGSSMPDAQPTSATGAEDTSLHGIAVDCLPSPLPDPTQQHGENSASADAHGYGHRLIASAEAEAEAEAEANKCSSKISAPVARRLFGGPDQAPGVGIGGSPPDSLQQQDRSAVDGATRHSCEGDAKVPVPEVAVSPGQAVVLVVADGVDGSSRAGYGVSASSDTRPARALSGSLKGPFSSTRGQRKLPSSSGTAEAQGADSQPLLHPEGRSNSSTTSTSVCAPGGGKAAGDGCGGAERGWGVRGLAARTRQWAVRQDWREWRRILCIGSVASLASGVMAGMTGIGGPPLMYMYDLLKVEKDVVRGTNAVMNVLQVRLVSYIVMGVFRRTDMPLYGAAAGAAMVGVALGNVLAGRMDQQAFSRVLVCLMVICCLLLLAAAAGLTTHK